MKKIHTITTLIQATINVVVIIALEINIDSNSLTDRIQTIDQLLEETILTLIFTKILSKLQILLFLKRINSYTPILLNYPLLILHFALSTQT